MPGFRSSTPTSRANRRIFAAASMTPVRTTAQTHDPDDEHWPAYPCRGPRVRPDTVINGSRAPQSTRIQRVDRSTRAHPLGTGSVLTRCRLRDLHQELDVRARLLES